MIKDRKGISVVQETLSLILAVLGFAFVEGAVAQEGSFESYEILDKLQNSGLSPDLPPALKDIVDETVLEARKAGEIKIEYTFIAELRLPFVEEQYIQEGCLIEKNELDLKKPYAQVFATEFFLDEKNDSLSGRPLQSFKFIGKTGELRLVGLGRGYNSSTFSYEATLEEGRAYRFKRGPRTQQLGEKYIRFDFEVPGSNAKAPTPLEIHKVVGNFMSLLVVYP